MGSGEPDLISIEEVRDHGWLADIFQDVSDELVRNPMKRNVDPRYPPASPEEIVEIFTEARDAGPGVSDMGVVLLAEKLKGVIAQRLFHVHRKAYFIV